MATAVRLKKNVKLECPHCHAAFLVQSGQKDSLCYNCGKLLDTQEMQRDIAAARVGCTSGYSALIADAQKLLAERKYKDAAARFSQAVKAAPDDFEAYYGLLEARTNHFTHFPERLPLDVYHAALACADSAQEKRIKAMWDMYAESHRKYWESKRRSERLRKEQAARKERQEAEARARREQAAASQTSQSSAGTENSKARRILRYVLMGVGICVVVLGIAACAAVGGGSGIFLLLGAGLLGGNRRDDRNGRR